MKFNLLLIICSLNISICLGQYDWTPGKIELKNGEIISGLVKIPMDNNIASLTNKEVQFRKNKSAKKQKFNENLIRKIFISGIKSDIGYYEYVQISPKKTVLMKLIKKGKTNLYIRTVKTTVNPNYKVRSYSQYTVSAGGNNIPMGGYAPYGIIKKIKEYYLIRQNEIIALQIIGQKENIAMAITNYDDAPKFLEKTLNNFENEVKTYFSDCADLVKYIENKLYDEYDITQMVEDYNLICEQF